MAELAVVPAQDLLELGSEARMNTPAVAAGNWSWRAPEGSWTAELAARLAAIVDVGSGERSAGKTGIKGAGNRGAELEVICGCQCIRRHDLWETRRSQSFVQ